MSSPVSIPIDAAICDLIADLSDYSDRYFDVQLMNLSEEEVDH